MNLQYSKILPCQNLHPFRLLLHGCPVIPSHISFAEGKAWADLHCYVSIVQGRAARGGR